MTVDLSGEAYEGTKVLRKKWGKKTEQKDVPQLSPRLVSLLPVLIRCSRNRQCLRCLKSTAKAEHGQRMSRVDARSFLIMSLAFQKKCYLAAMQLCNVMHI